ncbi:MAG: hypothetical protein DRP49_07780 [Spirochaetes bacterium]|nr:MAG: hypothetical protein DRP49_07780 [Spirochaetota bacterium]
MLSRRSFGSRVVPEAGAEERSRQNELVHSAHFAWESTPRDSVIYLIPGNPFRHPKPPQLFKRRTERVERELP